jgi:hypothetical protein
MVILGLVVLTGISVAGLTAWVYSGPEREKQASAIARQLFHFVYQYSQVRPAVSPAASGGTIK